MTEKEKIRLTIEDLFDLSSGVDEYGWPNAASALFLVGLDDRGEPYPVATAEMNTRLDISYNEGAVVVTAIFPGIRLGDFVRSARLALNWINEEKPAGPLILLVVPDACLGSVQLLFDHLVFCDFYDMKDGNKKLILCFDNTKTQLTLAEDIDMDEIMEQVEAEIRAETRAMDEELAAIEKELQDLNEQISGFKFEFDPDSILNSGEGETNNPNKAAKQDGSGKRGKGR